MFLDSLALWTLLAVLHQPELVQAVQLLPVIAEFLTTVCVSTGTRHGWLKVRCA